MSAAQLGSLLPHVTLAAVMPAFLIPEWGLTYSEGGLMAASYAAGYMLAVPVLATLTDRVDARWVLFWGSLLSGVATILFGLLASGLGSAIILWSLAGIGFGGAYMPGLKALTDRLEPGDNSRSVTLYTSSYSIGVGLSFLVAQVVAEHSGWRSAFLVTGLGPAAMAAVALSLRPVPPAPRHGALLDFRPVFRNGTALGYILAYGAHCFELYGVRTWIVAFWGFVASRGAGGSPLGAMSVSVAFTVLALPASILGNEAALRYGRHRAITSVMVASAVVGTAIGLTAGVSPWLTLILLLCYAITVPADSGALTSGTSAAAEPRYRGATLALHSAVGFGLSAAGGWAVGATIDAAGGPQSSRAWLAAFVLMSMSILLGPIALLWSRARKMRA